MKRLILFIFPLLTVLGFSAHDNKEAEEKIKKEIEKTKSVEEFIKVYNSFKYLF